MEIISAIFGIITGLIHTVLDIVKSVLSNQGAVKLILLVGVIYFFSKNRKNKRNAGNGTTGQPPMGGRPGGPPPMGGRPGMPPPMGGRPGGPPPMGGRPGGPPMGGRPGGPMGGPPTGRPPMQR